MATKNEKPCDLRSKTYLILIDDILYKVYISYIYEDDVPNVIIK